MGFLRVYSSIALVQKSAKIAYFDLRLFGQSVGGLTVKDNKLYLTINSKQQENNELHLKIKTTANPARKPYPWDSIEAQEIIKTFVEYKGTEADLHSEEHKYESTILHDLVQTKSKNKKITYCRPVMLSDYGFFQMRTVLGASKHKPKYSMKGRAATGGGIDILARIQHKNVLPWRLAVMELKDDNNAKECQPVVMTQALIYATFIGYLLRDEVCGEQWWNLFRNQNDKREIKKHIDIDVVTVMPSDKTGTLPESKREDIPVPGIDNVTLHTYSLYVDIDKNCTITKISGSLCTDKKE